MTPGEGARLMLRRADRDDDDGFVRGAGIDLGVWMDPRTNPRVARRGPEHLVVEIDCLLSREEDPSASAAAAPYRGQLVFLGPRSHTPRPAVSLRALAELPCRAADPYCLFELPLAADPRARAGDRLFDLPRAAHPYRDPGAPSLRRFALLGHRAGLEIVAANYEFRRAFSSLG